MTQGVGEADVTATAVRVGLMLEREGIPYAIGGALCLAVHGFARATRDVDVNVFCQPGEVPRVLTVLTGLGLSGDTGGAARDAATEGWFSLWDGSVRVDVFVPSIDFSWEAFHARVQFEFLGERIWFLAAESLCVFKLLFFRTKDLADLEQLVLTATHLDTAHVRATIAGLMGETDERVAAWGKIVAQFGAR
jgi:hypothetical protein